MWKRRKHVHDHQWMEAAQVLGVIQWQDVRLLVVLVGLGASPEEYRGEGRLWAIIVGVAEEELSPEKGEVEG